MKSPELPFPVLSTVAHDHQGVAVLTIDVRRDRALTFIEASGYMVGGVPVECFRRSIHALGALGDKYVVLNLSNILRIDPAGICAVWTEFLNAEQLGGKLTIVTPRDRVARELLCNTALGNFASLSTSEHGAINALFGWCNAA